MMTLDKAKAVTTTLAERGYKCELIKMKNKNYEVRVIKRESDFIEVEVGIQESKYCFACNTYVCDCANCSTRFKKGDMIYCDTTSKEGYHICKKCRVKI